MSDDGWGDDGWDDNEGWDDAEDDDFEEELANEIKETPAPVQPKVPKTEKTTKKTKSALRGGNTKQKRRGARVGIMMNGGKLMIG